MKNPIKKIASSWTKEAGKFFETSRKGGREIKKILRTIKTGVQDMRKKNSIEDGPDMSQFGNVLAHWGIEENEVEQVLKGLKIQRVAYAIIGMFGIAVAIVSKTLIVFSQGILLMILGGCVIIFRTWRISVIKKRKFIFFKDWILRGE